MLQTGQIPEGSDISGTGGSQAWPFGLGTILGWKAQGVKLLKNFLHKITSENHGGGVGVGAVGVKGLEGDSVK